MMLVISLRTHSGRKKYCAVEISGLKGNVASIAGFVGLFHFILFLSGVLFEIFFPSFFFQNLLDLLGKCWILQGAGFHDIVYSTGLCSRLEHGFLYVFQKV